MVIVEFEPKVQCEVRALLARGLATCFACREPENDWEPFWAASFQNLVVELI